MRGESRFGPHARFVDALREVLGYEPLYRKNTRVTDAERFGGTYPERAHAGMRRRKSVST